MEYETIKRHYLSELTSKEIIRYSRGRWIGIHCIERDRRGRQIFHRYYRDKPLTIESYSDLKNLFEIYEDCRPRTIYASINQYLDLKDRDNLYNLSNIYLTTPVWDVDNKIEFWRTTVEASKKVIDILRDHGVRESVYLKWSGEGMHIHINPEAFSKELRDKIHPLDIAYSVVEYVRIEAMEYIEDIKKEYNCRDLTLENKIDAARVFTTPLSIHRELDRVAICIKPSKLEAFKIEWTCIGKFRHDTGWRRYIEGEADELGYKAYEKIGGYPYPIKRRRRGKSVDDMVRKWLFKGDLY